MRKATRITAGCLGLLAGLTGLEHGYFEILQGNLRPASLIFASWGPPCAPEKIWHACEPAMSLLHSLLAAGILTMILGLAIVVWSAAFVQRKNGGLLLLLLSVALLMAGGGFFPPLIGIVGGTAGTQINKPPQGKPGSITHWVAKLWPWPLVILVIWLLGQLPVGYLFNDFLKSIMGFGLLLILALLPLSVYCAYAHDVVQGTPRIE